MTWEIPNKHGKKRNILMLVHKVPGEEFPDVEASVRKCLTLQMLWCLLRDLTVDHLVIQIKRRFWHFRKGLDVSLFINYFHIFWHVQRMEENRIPKRVSNMNLGTTRLRGRSRNRWQDEVREDGRIVSGEGWQKKVHDREDWKKFLRTARNLRILHTPMEWMNESSNF